MASTSTSKSRSYRRKGKFVPKPKPKQVWRVKQPTRNWLELPSDLMTNILQRIGVSDILENAQKVCTTWRAICKDPAMWRVINMDKNLGSSRITVCQKMCKHAVERSQGQLVELTMDGFCDSELLRFVADRASQLRRLEIVYYFDRTYGIRGDALKKFSLLEELSLVRTNISVELIDAAGRYCPLLKTLKLNQSAFNFYSSWNDEDGDDATFKNVENKIALAIGKNLPELTHLELIGNEMENIGLQAILDGCSHLELLDMRQCLRLDLKGDLGKRCSQQIKHLKLPHDSLEGCPHAYQAYDGLDDSEDESLVYFDSDDEYRYFDDYDYDDYVRFDQDGCPIIEDLNDWMAFKAMIE